MKLVTETLVPVATNTCCKAHLAGKQKDFMMCLSREIFSSRKADERSTVSHDHKDEPWKYDHKRGKGASTEDLTEEGIHFTELWNQKKMSRMSLGKCT